MFICDRCKKVTKPCEKQNKLVTKIREIPYIKKLKKGKEETRIRTEIVEELNLCEKCYESEEK